MTFFPQTPLHITHANPTSSPFFMALSALFNLCHISTQTEKKKKSINLFNIFPTFFFRHLFTSIYQRVFSPALRQAAAHGWPWRDSRVSRSTPGSRPAPCGTRFHQTNTTLQVWGFGQFLRRREIYIIRDTMGSVSSHYVLCLERENVLNLNTIVWIINSPFLSNSMRSVPIISFSHSRPPPASSNRFYRSSDRSNLSIFCVSNIVTLIL